MKWSNKKFCRNARVALLKRGQIHSFLRIASACSAFYAHAEVPAFPVGILSTLAGDTY